MGHGQDIERWIADLDVTDADALVIAGLDGDLLVAVREACDLPVLVYEPRQDVIDAIQPEHRVQGVLVCTSRVPLQRNILHHMLDEEVLCLDEAPGCPLEIKSAMAEEVAIATERAQRADRTLQIHGAQWARQMLESLPGYPGLVSMPTAVGVMRGTPALIVGAGPSLDSTGAALADVPPSWLVFACSTSWPSVLKHGGRADVIVAMDRVIGASYFDTIPRDEIAKATLVAGLQVDPTIFDLPWRRVVLAPHVAGGIGDWLRRVTASPAYVENGGSVSTVAVGCAFLLGCAPITLIGQDCALGPDRLEHCDLAPDGRSHYDERWETRSVTAWGGEGEVEASLTLDGFRRWLETFAGAVRNERDIRRLINASVGGARIEFWEEVRLEDVIEQLAGIEARDAHEALQAALDTVEAIDGHALTSAVSEQKHAAMRLRSAAREAAEALGRLHGAIDAAPLAAAFSAKDSPGRMAREAKKVCEAIAERCDAAALPALREAEGRCFRR